MTTRREARERAAAEARQAAVHSDDASAEKFGESADLFGDDAVLGQLDSAGHGGGRGRASGSGSGRKKKRPLWKSARLWVPLSIFVVLVGVIVGGGFAAKSLMTDALSAKDDLEKAMPLVQQVQQSMIEGDTEAAQSTVAQISALTGAAAEKTSSTLWMNAEWVPVAGPNLAAVRIAAASADTLVREAVSPLTVLSLDALVPQGGAVDLQQLSDLAGVVEQAAQSVEQVRAELDTIDREALLGPVQGGVAQIDAALNKVEPILEPAHEALTVLPTVLGADGPRTYLLLFQNNAESRGTGGNPAALAALSVVDGKISLTQQASSGDFANRRDSPIVELDPQTEALYGDKIGRWFMDVTLTPDFDETSHIVQAWWAESFGTPVDGVASFDPVALSYLLKATGPVQLPTGQSLTAQNAVPLLLNQVYSDYPDPAEQDLFFAGAAASVFDAVLGSDSDPRVLLEQLLRASGEGRLMFSPNDPVVADYLAGSKVSGTLPDDNTEQTVMGVYVNDITEGKLDYFMQLEVAAQSTQCEAPDAAQFTATATLTNTLTRDQVDGLAVYVAPGRFFAKGDVSTDLVVYGPVGATLETVTVNGKPVKATPMPHLGRSAVKVNVLTPPGATATVSATFAGADGPWGEFEVRHTPMVKPTPVELPTPQCK